LGKPRQAIKCLVFSKPQIKKETMARISRYEVVELFINNAGTKFSFTDQPQLRTQKDQEIFIKTLEVFAIDAYAFSQTNNAVAGVPGTELVKAVLVLYIQGEERVHYIPLLKLKTLTSDPAAFIPNNVIDTIEFDDLSRVDWTKSYVNFSTPPAGTPYVIPFGVTYLRVAAQNG
jgi:hypothetical protein